MRRIASIVCFAVLLSGCDTRAHRLAAIAEVEQVCHLPKGSLRRSGADSSHIASVGDGKGNSYERRFIDLGLYGDPVVLRKMKCIGQYRSSDGYWFNIAAIDPYVV